MIVHRDIIDELAKVALSFSAMLNEEHIRVHVGLAPVASEWPFIRVVNEWNIWYLILVLVLSHLSQWLHNEPKGDIALGLE